MPILGPFDFGLTAPMATHDLILIAGIPPVLAGLLGRLRPSPGPGRQEPGTNTDFLAQITSSCQAIDAAGPDLRDIAEAGFTQAASLIPLSDFLIGIFEEDHFRSLVRIQSGSRRPDIRLPLKDESLQGLAAFREDWEEDTISLRAQDSCWLQEIFESSGPSPDSLLNSQLRVGGRTLGLLIAGGSSLEPSITDGQLILDLLSVQLAHSLERHSLHAELISRRRAVRLINEISRRLISLGPLEKTFGDIASLILDAFGSDRVRLWERSESGVELKAVAPETASGLTTSDGQRSEAISQAIQESRTFQYVSLDLMGEEGEEHTVAGLAAPLRVEGKVLGVMEIEAGRGTPFSDQQIELAEMIAAQLAIATLESRHFNRQQQESYIRTVLLEVARHAAQPGDPVLALQSVLQLTTLITGTPWAMLMRPSADTNQLELAAMAGIARSRGRSLEAIQFDVSDFGIDPPFHESEKPRRMPVPDELVQVIGAGQANVFSLSDGEQLLGLMLTDASNMTPERETLLTGIAHQISLRLENARLMKEMSLRQALENEIATARDIQAGFLPRRLPVHAGWEIGIEWEAARDVGGDFYDFIHLDPSAAGARWGISVGDVSGKSVPAALFMAVCRTLLRSIGPSHVDPGMVLRRMNTVLQSESLSDFFISIFYAVWEPEVDAISYSNGGHNPPILVQADGEARWLSEHGMVLGVKEEVSYGTYRYHLAPGDLLVLYTDGVTEATSPAGEFFGTERLLDLCRSLHKSDAQSIAGEIGAHVRAFSQTSTLSDDMTIMTLKRSAEADVPRAYTNPPGGG